MKRRIYRDSHRRELYDALVELWLMGPRPGGTLYRIDGSPRLDPGSHAQSFWLGFRGEPDPVRVLPGGILERKAARAAGVDCAREARRRARGCSVDAAPKTGEIVNDDAG